MDSRKQVEKLTKENSTCPADQIVELLDAAKQLVLSHFPSKETQQQRERARGRSKSCGDRRTKRRQRRNNHDEQRPRSHGSKPVRQDVKIFLQNKPPRQILLRSQSAENVENLGNFYLRKHQRLSRSCTNLILHEEVKVSKIKQLVGEEGFAYWTKCVLALNGARQASSDVVEKKFKTLTEKFNEDQLETFMACLKNNEIRHLKQKEMDRRIKTKKKWKCEHYECRTILTELLQIYCTDQTNSWTIDTESTKPGIANQMQTSKGTDADTDKNHWFWFIGRLFSDSEISDSAYSDLGKMDISQLIKIHRNCKLFQFEGSVETYDTILSKRNGLMHSTNNIVPKGYIDETFEILYKLLLTFSTEVPSCKSSYEELKKLQKETLVVSMVSRPDNPVELALKCKEEAIKSDLHFADQTEKCELQDLLSTTSEQLTFLQEEKERNVEKRKEMEKEIMFLRSSADEMKAECLKFEKAYRQQTAKLKKRQYSVEEMQQIIADLQSKVNRLETLLLEKTEELCKSQKQVKDLEVALQMAAEEIRKSDFQRENAEMAEAAEWLTDENGHLKNVQQGEKNGRNRTSVVEVLKEGEVVLAKWVEKGKTMWLNATIIDLLPNGKARLHYEGDEGNFVVRRDWIQKKN